MQMPSLPPPPPSLAVQAPAESAEEEAAAPVFERYDRLLHGPRRRGETAQILSLLFVKKFIAYAKSRIRPTLSADASRFIGEQFANIRAGRLNDVSTGGGLEVSWSVLGGTFDSVKSTVPITPRLLETIIRLSVAHAKVRLSNVVEVVCNPPPTSASPASHRQPSTLTPPPPLGGRQRGH
jgi:DNA replication licensing factor MCM3